MHKYLLGFALIVFVVASLNANANHVHNSNNAKAGEDDLYEIVALVPMENMTLLAQTYIETDAQYMEMVQFLQSDEYLAIRENLNQDPDWQALKAWVSAGSPIDIDQVYDSIITMLLGGSSGKINQPSSPLTSARTIQDYVNNATALIPGEAIGQLVLYKIQTSPDFAALYAYLSSRTMKDLADRVMVCAPMSEMFDKLGSWDVTVDHIIQAVWNLFFGWGK